MRSRFRQYATGGKKVMAVSPSVVPNLGPISYPNSGLCVDEKHPGPPYRAGGPLSITKKVHRLGYSQDLSAGTPGSGAYWYQGKFYVAPVLINTVPFSPLSDSSLMAWGVKGYNRGLPVHNVANLGQAAIECRDLKSMAEATHKFMTQFRSMYMSPKAWADAWLNNVFGQVPFTNDLLSLLTAQRKLAERLRWLRSHNRKLIHRHFDLVNQTSDTLASRTETYASLQPVLNTGFYSLDGKHNGILETWKRETTRIWFDGAFTFMIPGLEHIDTQGNAALKAKLLGIVPDMNLLYKVTPWTWLIDWFTSVGASVQNSSLMQEYSQVAKYAYIMYHRKIVYTTYAYQYVRTGGTAVNPFSGPLTLVATSAESSYEVKQRGVASPYGFGVTWSGLNGFQLSVLAALGITRGQGGHRYT